MNRLLLICVATTIAVIGANAVAEEPDEHQQFTLTCEPGQATVFIGDHHVGMSHMRINHEDPWLEITIGQGDTIITLDENVTFVEVWVDLDGDEVDLGASCVSATTTTITTTTTKPVTSTTTRSTTTTTTPPTTATPPTTTTPATSTTATTEPPTSGQHAECNIICQCDPVCPCQTPTSATSSVNQWVWPVAVGWLGLLGAVVAGLFLRAGYIIGISPRL